MPDLKVVSLNTAQINEDAVKGLEEALEAVKSGYTTSVAIVQVHADRGVTTYSSKGNDFHVMSGGIALLQHLRFLHKDDN